VAVPLDANPDNFVVDQKGNVHYVDLTPPYSITREGELKIWEGIKIKNVKDYVFRHAVPAGIVQHFLYYAVRSRPELKRDFENHTLRFLEMNKDAYGLGKELEYIRGYVKSKQYLRDIREKRQRIRKLSGGELQPRTLAISKSFPPLEPQPRWWAGWWARVSERSKSSVRRS